MRAAGKGLWSHSSCAARRGITGIMAEPHNAGESPTGRKSTVAGGHSGTANGYLESRNIETAPPPTDTWDGIAATDVLKVSGDARYDIGPEIGRGAMGTVREARDLNIRRTVALKSLLPASALNPELVLRFIEEAQICGQLEHPGIAPVYELGVDGEGSVFYTMKRVRGRTLRDVLRDIRNRKWTVVREFPLLRLLGVFQRVCEAVSYAHSRNVIHRDLKPENIMVGEFGEVRVLDWGLAKVLVEESFETRAAATVTLTRKESEELRERIESVREDLGVESELTVNDNIMGTPPFMAPEQIADRKVGFHTDIYALGAILYNILCLKAPLAGLGLREILWRTVNGKIPPPTAQPCRENVGGTRTSWDRHQMRGPIHLPDQRVPEALSAVVMKAMARRPKKRYESVADLQKDVEAYVSGFATSAERAGFRRQTALLIRRHRLKFIAAAIVSASLAGILGVVYTHLAQSESRAQAALGKLRQTAPAFADQARLLMARMDMTEALARTAHAIELDPMVAA